jgi:hypothetical protein
MNETSKVALIGLGVMSVAIIASHFFGKDEKIAWFDFDFSEAHLYGELRSALNDEDAKRLAAMLILNQVSADEANEASDLITKYRQAPRRAVDEDFVNRFADTLEDRLQNIATPTLDYVPGVPVNR